MRVWLASYPRSGNTFFRIILNDRYGLPSEGMGTRLPREHLRRIDSRVRPIENPDAPRFVKTHSLPGDDSDPAIYLVRDGRDALISYAHFALVIDKGLSAEAVTPELFRSSLRNLIVGPHSPFGSWSRNADAWVTRPKTAVVKYEDLVADPFGVAERALTTLGLKLQPVADVIPTFDELKAADPKFFRRGSAGGHRDEFPADLLDLFWTHHGATMTRLGYARNATPQSAAA